MKMRYLLLMLTFVLLPSVVFADNHVNDSAAVIMTQRMTQLVIQLGLILIFAKIGNILFEKVKLPGVLGELTAGMILGPYTLGQIPVFAFSQGIFPMFEGFPVWPELYGLSAVAAIVLLFTVGLETDLGLLFRYSLAGFLVGMGGVIFSFFFGAATLVYFSEMVLGERVGFFAPVSLFAGIVATATSVGITARILSEKRKLDSPEGVTILSAAVIDDVIGIIMLAVVMGIFTATQAAGEFDWSEIGMIAAKAVGVWLVATTVGLLASRKISFLLKWFGQRNSIAIMAFGLALILGGVFEEVGLAMIIGAYVMGLSLSNSDIKHVVLEKLESVFQFLVPIFFFTIGMQINLGALRSPEILMFAGVYTVVGLLSKVLGCGLPAFLVNFNLRGAMRIGFGMAPRGEVGLIIAGIGLSYRLLSPDLFAAIVVMVVVNTLVAPPALVFLFRSAQSGMRKSSRKEEKPGVKLVFDFPSFQMTEFFVSELASVFEAEGFFVHLLSHEQMMYQVRKDETVIDFQCRGTNLTFDCSEKDVPFINTAMYEGLAALEQTITGLKKPLDVLPIGARVQEQAPTFAPTLSLEGYLTPSLIEPDLKGDTKEEVIRELLEILLRSGLIKNLEEAEKAVWTREKSMSTGLQYGVAIPHGKTDAVDRLVCSVGIKKHGVDFEAMDGEPSKIFFLTLSPEHKPAPHVQFMATISQVLDDQGRRRLLECKTSQEVYSVLVAGPKLPTPTPTIITKPPKFQLRDYLSPDLLEPNLKGRTKEEIINELLGLLEKKNLLRDAEMAQQAVLSREKQMPTGMQEGIAIPHGRTNAVENLVCAIGVKHEGVDFGSVDGKPTTIVVMALTSEKGTDPYLQFAAAIIRALDTQGRQRVLAAKTQEELYQALVLNA